MQTKDKSGSLGNNQYGGQKNKQSNDISIIIEMIIEFHQMTYIPIIITHHDNKGYFDQTVKNITTLNNRKFNVPK